MKLEVILPFQLSSISCFLFPTFPISLHQRNLAPFRGAKLTILVPKWLSLFESLYFLLKIYPRWFFSVQQEQYSINLSRFRHYPLLIIFFFWPIPPFLVVHLLILLHFHTSLWLFESRHHGNQEELIFNRFHYLLKYWLVDC